MNKYVLSVSNKFKTVKNTIYLKINAKFVQRVIK